MKTIIAANQGFSVVWQNEDDRKLWIGEPIIAWEIGKDVDVTAITTEGRLGDENWFGYLCPDGKVVVPHVQTFDSLEAASKT